MSDNKDNMRNCNFHKFEKNKYFYGKLMTVRDFETEQQYFDGKRYLINRLLHGAGIVCGFTNIELTKIKEGDTESHKIKFIDGGMALTCCGHEIAVPSNTEKQIVDEAGNIVSDLSKSSSLYLKYNPYYCGYVAVASNSSSCEEKCCPGRVIDDFDVVASGNSLSNNSPNSEINCKGKNSISDWLKDAEDKHKTCPSCGESQEDMVFLGKVDNVRYLVEQNESEKHRILFRGKELYQLFKCNAQDFESHIHNFESHVKNVSNPHQVTASQIEALVSVNSVSNPGGNIELVKQDAITIIPDDAYNRILIGETHSDRMDNPHNVTAAQTGALITLNQVKSLSGNIDLVQKGSIVIGREDNREDSITIGETHSEIKEGNPHNVTALETGALVSINGVDNLKGNIDLVQKGSIVIGREDDRKDSITIGETHSTIKEGNPHNVSALETGALVSVKGVSNPGGDIDLIEGMNIKITPGPNSIKLDCTLGLEVQPAETEIKSIDIENVVGTSNMYARADHVHKLEDNSVEYSKLSVALQEQLGILSMYVRERAFKCSASSFKKIAEDFKNDRAFDISLSFKKAIGKKLYEKEADFIKFMDSMQSPIKAFAGEIRELAEEGGLIDFENSLGILQKTIGEGTALRVATQQDEVCFYALELKLTVNNPMYKALNCTAVNFRKVADLFKSETASKISFGFEKAIDSRVYEDRDRFVKFMEENLELLEALSNELKVRASETSLNNYNFSVQELADAITLEDALEIASRQQDVCSYAQNLALSQNPVNNPMYQALNCAVSIYKEISRKLQSDIADSISSEFERAVNNRLYDNENDFIEFMEGNIDLLQTLPEEIEDLAIEEELTNYVAVVNELAAAIESRNAQKIAEKQKELCFYAKKLDPSTPMYRALKCTRINFEYAADLFENKTAQAISANFEEALSKKFYEEDETFIKFMEENLESFETFAEQIKELATKETLHNYISSVNKLADAIESGAALKIATRQVEVCSAARGLEIHLIA